MTQVTKILNCINQVLIIFGSRSKKANALLGLLSLRPDIDNGKYLFGSKYQLLIKIGTKKYKTCHNSIIKWYKRYLSTYWWSQSK